MTSFRSFYLATLGCKVNQYETQALREAWIGQGLAEAAAPEKAGFIVVNSCAVTAKAVADVRQTVSRLHRAAPGAPIFVTGCAAEVLSAELAALPGVSGVIGQSAKTDLLRLPFPAPKPVAALEDAAALPPVTPGPSGRSAPAYPPFAVSGSERSRAVLKIQDGCSHGCTYCIVPLTRGRARSRAFAESLEEARRLLGAGFREIVISGVNLRQYRGEAADSPSGGDFWDFLPRLDAALAPEWAGRARLRLSSLEPGQLGDKALSALAACRMVAPHLHLSLQSGSPSVLARMGRGHYDPLALPDFLARLRGLWPLFGLGADILTGFPAESEREFEDGLDLIRALPLTYAHVFPYSRRPGTRAAVLPGQIGQAVKKERAAVLRALVDEKKRAFLRGLLTVPSLRVVFEDRGADGRPGPPQGLCEYYVECRSGKKDAAAGPAVLAGALTPARPLAVGEGGVLLVQPVRAPLMEEDACV